MADPTAHQRPLALATAALMDIIARQHALQSAVIRGASPEEISVMRQEMHDVLDSYLDLSTEAANLVRALAP